MTQLSRITCSRYLTHAFRIFYCSQTADSNFAHSFHVYIVFLKFSYFCISNITNHKGILEDGSCGKDVRFVRI